MVRLLFADCAAVINGNGPAAGSGSGSGKGPEGKRTVEAAGCARMRARVCREGGVWKYEPAMTAARRQRRLRRRATQPVGWRL
jgi:hypothetical protein